MEAEKWQQYDLTFSTALKVMFKVLEHLKIPACLVGEVALNYYNVPTVVHDVEICVPDNLTAIASRALCETGLFELHEYKEFLVHTEYKRDFPRVKTTGWVVRSISVVIFSASFWRLEPLESSLIHLKGLLHTDHEFSEEILDSVPTEDLQALSFPLLPLFITGLCKRYLDTLDDMAMVAAEHLVDGMNLDEAWCELNLFKASEEVAKLVRRLISGKLSRIDYYQDNEITCFVKDVQEAKRLQLIPGYQ